MQWILARNWFAVGVQAAAVCVLCFAVTAACVKRLYTYVGYGMQAGTHYVIVCVLVMHV